MQLKWAKIMFVFWLSWKVNLPDICGERFERDQYTNELVTRGRKCEPSVRYLMKSFETEKEMWEFVTKAPRMASDFTPENFDKPGAFTCYSMGENLKPCQEKQCCTVVTPSR